MNNLEKPKKISTIQLIFLLILSVIISATLLRINNVKMIKRRDAVLNADKKNSQTELQERLFELQNFSFSHMNASTGPFFLEYEYRRDVQKIVNSVSSKDTSNEVGYQAIQSKCESKKYSWNVYLNCYKTELDKIGSSNSDYDTKVKLPNINLYRRDYYSPKFSFDWAGISIIFLLCILMILSYRFVARIVTIIIIKTKNSKNS